MNDMKNMQFNMGRNTQELVRNIKDPDDVLERKMQKYEEDLPLIVSADIFAKGAKQSRLDVLKSKLDKLAQEVRDEQRKIREKISETIDTISLTELAYSLESDDVSEVRERRLLNIQQRIVTLRKEIQDAISNFVD